MSISSVLIADDDGLFLDQLSSRLLKAGITEVVPCCSGQQVLAALEQHNDISAAILDMRLGEDNGLDLIESIQQVFPDCRIVMLTGYGSIPTAVEATRRGAIDYLLKPVDMEQLLIRLEGKPEIETNTPEIPSAPPSLARLEWDHIQQILTQNNGNISATAKQLGIDRRTLQRKLQKRPTAEDYQRDRQQK